MKEQEEFNEQKVLRSQMILKYNDPYREHWDHTCQTYDPLDKVVGWIQIKANLEKNE